MEKLNQTGFFEGGVGAVFVDGFDGAGREGEGDALIHFRNEDFLLLKVRIFADFAGRVVLRGSSSV